MRLLKYLILASTAVLTAFLLGAAAIWFYPGSVVNERVLPKAVSWLRPGVGMEWERLELRARSSSFWRKDVAFTAKNLCFRIRGTVDACLKAVRLDFTVDLRNWRDPAIAIDDFLLMDDKIVWEARAKESTGKRSDLSSGLAAVHDRLKRIELRRVTVHLNDLYFGGREGRKLRIAVFSGRGNDDPLRFGAELHGRKTFQLSGEIKKENRRVSGPWSANLAFGEPRDAMRMRASLDSSSLLVLDVPIQARVSGGFTGGDRGEVAFEAEGVLHLSEQALRAEVKRARFRDVQSKMSLSAEGCRLGTRLDTDRFGAGSFLHCPKNRLDLTAFQKRDLVRGYLPENLDFQLQIDHEESRARWMSYSYSLRFEPVDNDLVEFRLRSSGRFSMPFRAEDLIVREIDFDLGIKRYSELITRIGRAFDLLIPAPFHRLQGTVKLNSSKKDWLPSRHPKIPLAARVDLKGPETRLAMGFVGDLEGLFERPHVTGRVRVDEAVLRLPSLDPLYGFPKLRNDPRLQRRLKPPAPGEELRANAGASPVSYHIEVETANADAFKLYYYLAEPYVPVELDLVVTPRRVAGSVKTRDFALVYLKKKVDVQSLAIRLDDPPVESKINSLITAERGAYQLRMEVIGSVGAPRIYLTSQPDLSRDEILALMLYNKMPSRLTEGENRDASELNAALNDHAIGLLGAWALSSVPIDSISYNSATKTYAAQVNLPSEVTLSIGSDWENLTGVELAKRFGMNWFLVSSYEPREEVSEGRMMLEWRRSY